jgi:F-type H+-transporting ATPase subunit alpha
LTTLLTQKKNNPYSLADEVILIWAVNKGFFDTVPAAKLPEIEERLLALFQTEKKATRNQINKNKDFDEKDEKEMTILVKKVLQVFGYES